MLAAGVPELMANAILELIRPTTSGRDFKTTTVRDVTGREPRSFDEWAATMSRCLRLEPAGAQLSSDFSPPQGEDMTKNTDESTARFSVLPSAMHRWR